MKLVDRSVPYLFLVITQKVDALAVGQEDLTLAVDPD